MSSESPIFLAGTDRSGIGLLGELLNAHPRLAISRRTNFFSFYFERFGDLEDQGNFERCLVAMLGYRRIHDLVIDVEGLKRRFETGPKSYSRLYALIHEQHIEHVGKSRWGDKSLNSERHADRILGSYPEARIIHIIRDPRDRYASQALHRGVSRGGVGAATALWEWSVRLAEQNLARHPLHYLVIRYETLVHRPEATLDTVCRFIGEEYKPEMIGAVERHDSTSPVRLLTGSIGRFRRDVSTRELAFIQLWAHALMERNGYATVPIRLSWPETLAFLLVDLPWNSLGLALWRPNAALRELVGRKPSKQQTIELEDI